MCRGYISRGNVYHNGINIVGPGYQEVYEKGEKQVTAFKRRADERGTPFVEIDQSVCEYIRNCGDKCVNEMFERMVKSDGIVTALFPFKRMSHSFIIGDFLGHRFNPEKERESNDGIRQWIKKIKDSLDTSNPEAVEKTEHYINALNEQLKVCESTDELLNFFSRK